MFTFKPKKVFEKLNKMDRKQAYTIGAIAVVMIVALLMLVSAATSGGEDSFDGMDSHGYDLAQMPFATDAAEQYLLASKYPDMKENGSTLLYSAAEKEQRQEEDAQAAEDESVDTDSSVENTSDEDNYSSGYSGRGYGGYARGGGTGRGATEIGQLSHAGMASASGSGVSSTYGPSGDFRQFKGRENRGDERPAQFKTADGRQALAQFRSGSLAAARINENKMTGARKALMGGMVQGSDAFGKDGGVDLSKLQSGGLTLDTSAPSTTTDLDNLDKKVADAAKKAEDKKKEENKRKWWEDMLIDLAKQAASSLVKSFMDITGDTIKGAINGKQAQYAARKEANTQLYNNARATKSYEEFQEKYGRGVLTEDQYAFYTDSNTKLKDTYKYEITYNGKKIDGGKRISSNNGGSAQSDAWRESQNSTNTEIPQNTGDDKQKRCNDCKASCDGNTSVSECNQKCAWTCE